MVKTEKQKKSFVKCWACGHDKFLVETSGLDVIRLPQINPSEFEKVSKNCIEYAQCNECGEQLNLDDIGLYCY